MIADTIFIKSIVSSWQKRGGELRFPNGPLVLTETIELGNHVVSGGRVTCETPADEYFAYRNPKKTSVEHLGSRIIWDGPADQPMFTYQGMNLIWDGPALWGKTIDFGGNKPSAGIEVRKSRSLGTGRMRFKQLHACGVGSAIDAVGATNCDQFHVERACVYDCDHLFRSASSQNVGNLFGYVIAHTIHKSLFRFESLTTTAVEFVMVNSGVRCLLSFNKSAGQAGSFSVRGMKVDPASDGTILAENDTWSSFAQLNFRDCVGSRAHRFNLHGEFLLNIDSCQNIVSKGCVTGRALPYLQGQVVVSNSRISETIETPNDIVNHLPHFNARLHNCSSTRDNEALGEKNLPIL